MNIRRLWCWVRPALTSIVTVEESWYGMEMPHALLWAICWRRHADRPPTILLGIVNNWAGISFGPDVVSAWVGQAHFHYWRPHTTTTRKEFT